MVRIVVRSPSTTIDFHTDVINEFDAVTCAAALIKALSDLEKVMLFGEIAVTINKDKVN